MGEFDEDDLRVPEIAYVLGGVPHGCGVIEEHRGVIAFGVLRVKADDGDVGIRQLGGLLGAEQNRGDDDVVGVLVLGDAAEIAVHLFRGVQDDGKEIVSASCDGRIQTFK
ncbi:hypothetical protein CJI55_04635 [Gardnerella vaginalis]|nr:hypothetical protein CGSMWGv75712_01695 [Gardnerella vaginalis 75712]RIY22692.1 hypothetical protein CJI55_04635 [Gardnerella vaginalis]